MTDSTRSLADCTFSYEVKRPNDSHIPLGHREWKQNLARPVLGQCPLATSGEVVLGKPLTTKKIQSPATVGEGSLVWASSSRHQNRPREAIATGVWDCPTSESCVIGALADHQICVTSHRKVGITLKFLTLVLRVWSWSSSALHSATPVGPWGKAGLLTSWVDLPSVSLSLEVSYVGSDLRQNWCSSTLEDGKDGSNCTWSFGRPMSFGWL